MEKFIFNKILIFIESKNYKLLSRHYINCKTKLLIQCDKGHKFKMDWNHFNRGQRCKFCLSKTIEEKKEYKKNWYKNNKEHAKKWQQNYLKTLKGKALHNNNNARYRAKKKNQSPKLTKAEKENILLCYQFTRFLNKFGPYFGKFWEVDHIIPLSIGGLHHPNNLQLLTKEENCSKNNNINFNIDPMSMVSMRGIYG